MAITVTKNLMEEKWEDGDNVISVQSVATPDHYNVASSDMSKSITLTMDTLTYGTLSDGTLEVLGVKSGALTPERIEIPSTYKGQKVTEIADSAFLFNKEIKEITIPAGIRRIRSAAFENSCIEKVIFKDNNLRAVYFQCPDGWGVPHAEYAYGSDVAEYDGGMMQLVDVNKNIYGCLIPVNINSIYFLTEDKSKETLHYYSNEGPIVNCLFAVYEKTINSNKYYVIEPTTDYIPGADFNGLDGLRIEFGAFRYCNELTSITLPQRTTFIGSEAFTQCEKLITVSFTEHHRVSAIGSSAFANCTALEVVTMYNGISEIGAMAFYKCTKLSSCVLGDGLQIIGENAFGQCAKLRHITIPASVKRIEKSAFEGRPTSDLVDGRNRWIIFESPSTWIASESGTVPADGNGVFLWNGSSTETPPPGATIVFMPSMLTGLSEDDSNVLWNGELLSEAYCKFVWFKLEKMLTPQVSLSGNTLSMTDPLGIADAFNIYTKDSNGNYSLKCYVRVD